MITKTEKKIIDIIIEKKYILLFVAIVIISLLARYTGRDFVSGDMKWCLQSWYETVKDGGIKGLKDQVGDYNLLYQTIIYFMTIIGKRFDIDSIYLYKALSVIFDYVLAFLVAKMVCDFKQNTDSVNAENMGNKGKVGSFFLNLSDKQKMLFCITFFAVSMLPTVVLNSAFWGQCDSIYTSFCLLTIYYLYKEKYIRAYVFLGIAMAFKLQTVFILPFVVLHYFIKKKYSLVLWIMSMFVFWMSGIMTYIEGRSIFAPFSIYLFQTSEYPKMYLNVSSFWILLNGEYINFGKYAVALALMICGAGFIKLLGKKDINNGIEYMRILGWFVWTCVLFLPAMHERYTYMLDMILLLLALLDKKYIKYALFSIMFSFISYGAYFYKREDLNMYTELIYVCLWMHYTVCGNVFSKDVKESE